MIFRLTVPTMRLSKAGLKAAVALLKLRRKLPSSYLGGLIAEYPRLAIVVAALILVAWAIGIIGVVSFDGSSLWGFAGRALVMLAAAFFFVGMFVGGFRSSAGLEAKSLLGEGVSFLLAGALVPATQWTSSTLLDPAFAQTDPESFTRVALYLFSAVVTAVLVTGGASLAMANRARVMSWCRISAAALMIAVVILLYELFGRYVVLQALMPATDVYAGLFASLIEFISQDEVRESDLLVYVAVLSHGIPFATFLMIINSVVAVLLYSWG
jgi:hypothetical protein